MSTHFDIPEKSLEMVPEVKKISGDNQSVWINSTLHKNSISVKTSLEIRIDTEKTKKLDKIKSNILLTCTGQ